MKRLFALLFLLTLFSENACAQGIGVSPDRIFVDAVQGGKVVRQLTVFNPSEEPILFSAEGSDLFTFSPAEAMLPVGQSRKITVEIIPKKYGMYEETIYIELKPKAGGGSLAFGLSAAVAVEMSVKARGGWVTGTAITTGIVAFGLGAYILSKR